jgi:hypothetical protein
LTCKMQRTMPTKQMIEKRAIAYQPDDFIYAEAQKVLARQARIAKAQFLSSCVVH